MAANELDLNERQVVLAGLVDAHVHLEKAYVLAALEQRGLVGGGVAEAIAATRQLRGECGLGMVRPDLERLLAEVAADGTVAAGRTSRSTPASIPQS